MSSAPLRKRLQRDEHSHHLRFLTFSTYQRLPLFANSRIRDRFAAHLARAREKFSFNLYAWVVMPEHIHLLLWPLIPEFPVSEFLGLVKSEFASEVIDRWRELRAPVLARLTDASGRTRFWQRGGGHDRNIFTARELSEKIEYIHQNPVKRGLVPKPEDWAWSSARWYSGDHTGVPLDPLPPKRPTLRAGFGSA